MDDTTNLPEDKSLDMSKLNKEDKDLSTLTDQNWLFIKYFLELGDIRKAYKLAGYTGTNQSSPYQLFKTVKGHIEELGSLDIASRSRLLAEVNRLLDLPLAEDKKSLTFSERLRLLKFISSITPEVSQNSKLSVMVINRYQQANGPIDVGTKERNNGETNNLTLSINEKDVIDTDALD